MNRTDRLYAMVEELRAVAPRPRSARWLAGRFEVCARTVERDIGALQQAGVAIYAESGRNGGYVLDPTATLPPVNVTPGEAVAIAVGLRALAGTPFHSAARSALVKLLAVMPERDTAAARDLAGRVHLLRGEHPRGEHPRGEHPRGEHPRGDGPAPSVPPAIADALSARRVLIIEYADRAAAVTVRRVEPLGYVGGPNHWYLVGWCRLRQAVRAFRLDRIVRVCATGEAAPVRPLGPAELDIPRHLVTQLTLT